MKSGLILAAVLLTLLTACAGLSPKQIEATDLAIERIATASAMVSQATAYREGENLIVVGKLRRTHETGLAGHVDVTLWGPEGFLAGTTVRIPGLDNKRGGMMDLPFTARLDAVPSTGTRLSLRYHPPGAAAGDGSRSGSLPGNCPEGAG